MKLMFNLSVYTVINISEIIVVMICSYSTHVCVEYINVSSLFTLTSGNNGIIIIICGLSDLDEMRAVSFVL